jgi:hypothetical protein
MNKKKSPGKNASEILEMENLYDSCCYRKRQQIKKRGDTGIRNFSLSLCFQPSSCSD